MHAITRAGLLLTLCLGLAACPRPVQPPAPAPSVPPSAPSAPPGEVPGATNYRIDPQASTQSGFEIAFPVADLIVDDPETRRAAGSEFPPEIPDADKQGTRKNMLRAEVLDAENYPRVELKSVKVEGKIKHAVQLLKPEA